MPRRRPRSPAAIACGGAGSAWLARAGFGSALGARVKPRARGDSYVAGWCALAACPALPHAARVSLARRALQLCLTSRSYARASWGAAVAAPTAHAQLRATVNTLAARDCSTPESHALPALACACAWCSACRVHVGCLCSARARREERRWRRLQRAQTPQRAWQAPHFVCARRRTRALPLYASRTLLTLSGDGGTFAPPTGRQSRGCNPSNARARRPIRARARRPPVPPPPSRAPRPYPPARRPLRECTRRTCSRRAEQASMTRAPGAPDVRARGAPCAHIPPRLRSPGAFLRTRAMP